MAWRADAGVDHDRDGGLLDDDANLIASLDAPIGSNGSAERHDCGRADVLQPLGQHRVGVDVRQYGEALGNKCLGGIESLNRIRQQVARIRMNLEFDPLGETGGSGEFGQPHGFVGVHRATCVRQDEILFGVDEFQNVGVGIVVSGEIRTSQGDGHDLCAAG